MWKNLGALGAFGAVLLTVFIIFFNISTRQFKIGDAADFTFNNETEPQTLDPGKMTGQPEGRIAQALYEGLTVYDPKTLEPRPGVATHWDISPDGKTYTFHLRKNSYWVQQGKRLRPVTAQDFVYSWKRIMLPEEASEYAYILYYIKGIQKFSSDQGKLYTAIIEEWNIRKRDDFKRFYPQWQARAKVGELDTLSDNKRTECIQEFKDKVFFESPEIIAFVEKQRKLNPRISKFEDIAEKARKKFRTEFDKSFSTGGSTNAIPPAVYTKYLSDRQAQWTKNVGLRAIDDFTLEVELEAPTPYFTDITCFYATSPVNRECIEEHKDQWIRASNLVSNGPFFLKYQRFNEVIRLQVNEFYWDRENVGMRTIDALAVEEGTTAFNMYEKGKIDWIPTAPPKLIDKLKNRDDFHTCSNLMAYFYRMNLNRPIFKGRKGKLVRQALSLAIDRKTLVRVVSKGGEKPAYSIVPPGVEGFTGAKGLQKDSYAEAVIEAKRLLAEAGYPDGKGFPKVLLLYNNSEKHAAIAAAIQDFWKRSLNVEIQLQNQEWGTYLDSVTGMNYDMARAGWIGDYTDPNTFLDMWIKDGPQNNTGWSSELYDRLIQYAKNIGGTLQDTKLRKQFLKDLPQLKGDVAKFLGMSDALEMRFAAAAIRFKVFTVADQIIADELPILPIFFYTTSQLWRKSLGGLHTNLRDTHLPKFFHWKKGKKSKEGSAK